MDIGGWFKPQDSGGWLAACLPRPPLSPSQREALQLLPARLAELGYTEHAVREWLGLDLSLRRFQQVPGYLVRLRKQGLAGRLAAFALLRHPLASADAQAIFGAALPILADQGVLTAGDTVEPKCDLYPCEGAYLYADLKFSPHQRLPNHVYEVGGDSYSLARTTPRRQIARALDLCTGSGVHAVLAARHADEATGVDINARAVDLSTLNAALNNCQATFRKGSLYEPVTGEFDLITANTPFVPTPPEERLEAYRDGGQDGDEINRQVVAGAARRLTEGGTLALFTNFTIGPRDILDRVHDWLGSGSWGLALLQFGGYPREAYIELQTTWGSSDVTRWNEYYDEQGIEAIGEGTFLVTRLPEGHPGYRERLELAPPERPLPVDDWLAALQKYSTGVWEGTPSLRPDVESHWSNWTGSVPLQRNLDKQAIAALGRRMFFE